MSQREKVRASPKKLNKFCAALNGKTESKQLSTIKAVAASTDDGVSQDIHKTFNGYSTTFWSSNPSVTQDKEDWLLFDLGEVVVVNSIGFAPYRAIGHPG